LHIAALESFVVTRKLIAVPKAFWTVMDVTAGLWTGARPAKTHGN
jgi:hypothetical protein